jgi:hypothetical protein
MTSHNPVFQRLGLGAVALAGLVALVGCGASSDAATVAASPAAATTPHAATSTQTTTSTHAVTSTRSGTSRSAAGEAIDRRIARDAQLRLTDFPARWTSTPRPAASIGARCPAIRGAKAAASARQASPQFMLGSATMAGSSADTFADVATATHWFVQLASPETRTCLVRALRESVGFQAAAQGASLDSVTARRLNIAPGGDQHTANRFVVRLSDGKFRGKAEPDVIYVRVGRGIVALSVNQVGGPFDRSLETRLVRTVSDRLAAGLKGAQ